MTVTEENGWLICGLCGASQKKHARAHCQGTPKIDQLEGCHIENLDRAIPVLLQTGALPLGTKGDLEVPPYIYMDCPSTNKLILVSLRPRVT